MNYACVKCQRFFHIKKNGAYIEEGMPIGPNAWGPYKLWAGDVYECPGCHTQLFISAQMPIAEHYQTDYQKKIERYKPITRIEDC